MYENCAEDWHIGHVSSRDSYISPVSLQCKSSPGLYGLETAMPIAWPSETAATANFAVIKETNLCPKAMNTRKPLWHRPGAL